MWVLSAISQLALFGATVAGASPRACGTVRQLTRAPAELSQPFQESFFGHSDLAVTSLCEFPALRRPLFRTARRSLTPESARAGIYLSTVVFTFSIIGIFGPQHRAHAPSARNPGDAGALARIARRMDQEGMGGVAVCWVSSVTVSVGPPARRAMRCGC